MRLNRQWAARKRIDFQTIVVYRTVIDKFLNVSNVRIDSLEKTLMMEKIEGRRRRGQQKMEWLEGITDTMDMSLSKLQEMIKDRKPGMLYSIGSQRVRHD